MSNIVISVLLPTRARPKRLQNAVRTLIDTAARPSEIEILFRTDDDDQRALEICEQLLVGRVKAEEFRGPRYGYARIFENYNELALAASGRFVFLWNDDTEMLTTGWDQLLVDDADPKRPEVQFLRRDTVETADDTLPFIDKQIVDALGGISRHMYTDTWISHVSRDAAVRRMRDDVVFHHHRLHDQTAKDNEATLHASGQHETFHAMQAEKADDIRKIHELLARLGSATA